MAEFKEKKAVAEILLPGISRTRGEELHSPIDSMSRSASYIRLTSESVRVGGATAVIRAEQDMAIARNVSDLRLEGSDPVRQRFRHLLNALG